MEKLDIKNIIEVLDAAFESVDLYKELKSDGKLDWSDAAAVGSKLVTDAKFREIYTKAVDGLDKIPAEAKDIDLDEAGLLITYLIGKIKALKA